VSSELPDNNPSNNVSVLVTPVDQGGCPAAPTASDTILLLQGRLSVQAAWSRSAISAQGFAVSDHAGYFYFADNQRIDVVVQVQDSCATTGQMLVSVLGASGAIATVRVTDNATGAVWTSTHLRGGGAFNPRSGALACAP
jgi:hypothetical protein